MAQLLDHLTREVGYLIGYVLGVLGMTTPQLIARARRYAGLSQDELARRAHTSRTALSAYEHGRKSPTLDTAKRLLGEAGFELTATPKLEYIERLTKRGRSIWVPTRLGRLDVSEALATVTLPLHLNWSQPRRTFRLADRAQRARAYEIVLQEGGPEELAAYIDGALLVDVWDELVVPRDIRQAWTPLIAAATSTARAS